MTVVFVYYYIVLFHLYCILSSSIIQKVEDNTSKKYLTKFQQFLTSLTDVENENTGKKIGGGLLLAGATKTIDT